jgi:hypothetical protein
MRPQRLRAHRALHALWTRNVKTDGYDKSQWSELEAAISEAVREAGKPMEQQKPLRVKVAEALGCKPVRVDAPHWAADQSFAWRCECGDPSEWVYPHGRTTQRGIQGELLHWDADWHDGGPLIQKYRLGIEEPGKDGGPMLWTAYYHYREAAAAGYEHGETPLVAVCNLLLEMAKSGRLDLRPGVPSSPAKESD